MAVYAAYRHIELDNVGYGKKRVLKPPGGGTSDIFGAPDPVQNSPRRVRNNMQSSVFGPPPTNGEITPRSKMGCDSYNRLFGPADSRPQSATKNRLKSSIILSNDADSSPPKDNNSNSPIKEISAVDGVSTKASMPRRNPVTGDGMYFKEIRRSARRRDGNPVTGEGYTNGEKQPAANNAPPAAAAAPTTNGTSHSAPPQRNRVPPGGYSSGLW
ncbi:hypothetical protein R5R35_000227 [Gryllus longicercus]|uniref:Microtubule-associated protein Jupiter n=1 Tax=Gryllus longicercus TaxID=2509291 RepID=A0AAN9ZGS1_9ORTH